MRRLTLVTLREMVLKLGIYHVAFWVCEQSFRVSFRIVRISNFSPTRRLESDQPCLGQEVGLYEIFGFRAPFDHLFVPVATTNRYVVWSVKENYDNCEPQTPWLKFSLAPTRKAVIVSSNPE
jgi:hypothetical protein